MREQRLVFGEAAELYEQMRPSYPAGLLDDVVSLAGPGAHVVEAGAGTGKATRLLAARGCTGAAVEADPAMAGIARRELARYPGWRVELSEFEDWAPRPGERFDLAVSAQAWHWLRPGVRFEQAHRLLRGGGWLALWWNRPGEDTSGLPAEIEDVYKRLAPGMSLAGMAGSRDAPLDDFPGPPLFQPPEERAYPWSRDYTAAEWAALSRTQSDHRLLPAEQLDRVLRAVEEVIDGHGGVYHHQYSCRLWLARRC